MTQRDWQKDMELCQEEQLKEDSNIQSRMMGALGSHIASYWLQEAKIYKQSYEGTLTSYTAGKARADAAEAREQQLKEAVQLAINDLGLWGDKIMAANVVLGQLQRTLSTLYPDTPAPTAKINLWDDVSHPEYGRGGVLEIIGTKARVSFDELDYHITLEISDLTPAPKEGE